MITKAQIAKNPSYPSILHDYNEEFKRTSGKVNNLKFYRDVISVRAPEVSQRAWYDFIRRFKSNAGAILATAAAVTPTNEIQGEAPLMATLLKNDEATQIGIGAALNLGAAFYKRLWKKYNEDPNSLNQFEQKVLADSLHKAMKSQDSRIHALGKIREDGREQVKFERTFQGASLDN